MTAWYNENDDYAADWLENLIAEKLIAPGIVDRRSIVDVRAVDLVSFAQCHFFAGLGGWSRALRIAGTPDTRPLWTGSCPCQPFSLAGSRRGFEDERHLWPVWLDLIRKRRPARIFGEQVASAAAWLRLVRGDLEALGYAVGAIPIEAASAGADHLRDRFWFVADGDRAGLSQRVGDPGVQREAMGAFEGQAAERDGLAYADLCQQGNGDLQRGGEFGALGGDPQARAGDVGNAGGSRAGRHSGGIAGAEKARGGAREADWHLGNEPIVPSSELEWVAGADGKARRVKPGIRLLAHGIPARVAKLRALGNAIDPRPAAEFIRACC